MKDLLILYTYSHIHHKTPRKLKRNRSLIINEAAAVDRDPKRKVKTLTALPAANDGEIDLAEEAGPGTCVSAAAVAPTRDRHSCSTVDT